jgi:hypothetical protein
MRLATETTERANLPECLLLSWMADIAPAGGDSKIDFLDFAELSTDWLKQ